MQVLFTCMGYRAGTEERLNAHPCGSLENAAKILTSLTKSAAQRNAYFRVLRVVEANPEFSQRKIAEVLGVSSGSVNFCLKSLVKVGLVKVKNFRSSDNKLRYSYILTPKGCAEKAVLARFFLKNKMAEYQALKDEIEAISQEIAELSDPQKIS